MARLFIAVDLTEEARGALARTIEGLRPLAPRARWVSPEDLHVTVAFLGELPEERAPAIVEAMGSAAGSVAPGMAVLDGIGAFPSLARARVVFAAVADDGTLASLARVMAQVAAGLGIQPEDRPFRPHVTLARLLRPMATVPAAGPAPVAFEVAEIVLYRSRPQGGSGPRYEPLGRAALGDRPG